MARISIRSTLPQLSRQMRGMSAEVQDKILAASVNKAADRGRVQMRRQIQQEFNIRAGEVNSQLKLQKASARGNQWVASIEAFPARRGRRSRNVMLFSARSIRGGFQRVQATRRTKRGVSIYSMRVRKGGGVSVRIRKGRVKIIRSAFIGNQRRTVFARVGKARLPIKGVETIDVPSMFNTRRINSVVRQFIERQLAVEAERALNRFSSRLR